MEWHIGQAGSPGAHGKVKQRHADIREHWDGKIDLAEQKRNGQVLRGARMIFVRKLAFTNGTVIPPGLELGFQGIFTPLLVSGPLFLVTALSSCLDC